MGEQYLYRFRRNGRPKSIKTDVVWFLVVIVFVVGLIAGYAWRMAQVKSIERDIVQALTNCKQLITDELVIAPVQNCEKTKTAVMGLRKNTFQFLRNNTKEGK